MEEVDINDITRDFLVKEDYDLKELKYNLRYILRERLKDSEYVLNNLNNEAFVKDFLEDCNKQFTMADIERKKPIFSYSIKSLTKALKVVGDRIEELETL